MCMGSWLLLTLSRRQLLLLSLELLLILQRLELIRLSRLSWLLLHLLLSLLLLCELGLLLHLLCFHPNIHSQLLQSLLQCSRVVVFIKRLCRSIK